VHTHGVELLWDNPFRQEGRHVGISRKARSSISRSLTPRVSKMDLSNDQITEILMEEAKRLDDISPSDHVEAKCIEQQKEVVKVMKILHAQKLAQDQGYTHIP
jgi:hypothetical protein